MNEWLFDRLNEWMKEWLIDWLTYLLTYLLTHEAETTLHKISSTIQKTVIAQSDGHKPHYIIHKMATLFPILKPAEAIPPSTILFL